MEKALAQLLTTALVQFIDRERPEGTMCCSSIECERIESSFKLGDFPSIEQFIKRKLSGLATEFEQELAWVICEWGNSEETKISNFVKKYTPKLLALAKNELLSYADESNPAIEAMADLERTFSCNPDKLPKWLKDELTKKHLEGYCMGREDALREMKDFVESHFNTKKALEDSYRKEYTQPLCLRFGGVCTNPMRDCLNCTMRYKDDIATSTSSGTSTLKAEG